MYRKQENDGLLRDASDQATQHMRSYLVLVFNVSASLCKHTSTVAALAGTNRKDTATVTCA